MKIMYLTDEYPPESVGGAGSVAKRLAEGIAEAGHEVSVVATAATRRPLREKSGAVTVYWLQKERTTHPFLRGLYNPTPLACIGKILSELQPDVVHAHNLHWQLSYAALPLARKFTERVFLTAHDLMYVAYGKLFPPEGRCLPMSQAAQSCRANIFRDLRAAKWQYLPWRGRIIRRSLRVVRTIFTVSDFIRAALEANGIPRCVTMHNGIDTRQFLVSPDALRRFRAAQRIDSPHVVFFGGRSGAAKGLYALLDAIVVLRRRYSDVLLLVAAREGENAEIAAGASARGIGKHIRYTGWLDEDALPLAYAVSSVVATPSLYFDPFPTVNLEAMAAARPVVGTCFGGTPEAIQDGVNGYIINPYHTGELAEKIIYLLGNQDLCRYFGEAGYRRVREKFSLTAQLRALYRAYDAL